MYEAYWQLTRRPFDDGDLAGYYPTESHQGALLKLRYALETGGVAVLAGESGVGKTLLVALLRRQLGNKLFPTVMLQFPQLRPAEMLAYLADEFGAPAEPGTGADRQVRRLEGYLRKNSAAGHTALVIVDEAQLLPAPDSLDTLRLLLGLNHEGRAALLLLLVGQPELLVTLDRLGDWESRLRVKCLLRRLTLEETASYLSHRLATAGCRRTIFSSDAMESIYSLSQGVARRINRLADLSLLVAYAEDRSSIDGRHVEAVAADLVQVGTE